VEARTITVARFKGVRKLVHDIYLRRFNMLSILQNYVVTLLRDKGGANAVEYALIMALVAVFIIAGVLAMSGAIGTLFNSMATCLGNAPGCNTGTFSG
jgi:Flp pilus assembly pilin Flp